VRVASVRPVRVVVVQGASKHLEQGRGQARPFGRLGPSGAEIRLGLQQGPTDDQVRVGGRSVAGRKRRPEEGYGDLGI